MGFAIGMRIRIDAPHLHEHGKQGEIVKEFDYAGFVYFIINIDGYGYLNKESGEYLMYPREYLVAIPPEIKIPAVSSWEKFDSAIGMNLANTIIG